MFVLGRRLVIIGDDKLLQLLCFLAQLLKLSHVPSLLHWPLSESFMVVLEGQLDTTAESLQVGRYIYLLLEFDMGFWEFASEDKP